MTTKDYYAICKLVKFKDYDKLEIVKQKYQDILGLLVLVIIIFGWTCIKYNRKVGLVASIF